jgi:hypothetical protein
VIVNGLKIEQAIWACQLQHAGQVPNTSTLYSCVKIARDGGTYKNEIRKAEVKKIGVVIDILDDRTGLQNILPVTITRTTTTALHLVTQLVHQGGPRNPRSPITTISKTSKYCKA